MKKHNVVMIAAAALSISGMALVVNCSSPVQRAETAYPRNSPGAAARIPGSSGGWIANGLASPAPADAYESELGRLDMPGALPSPDEELWIIQRPQPDAVPDPDAPGCGALMARLPTAPDVEVPVPLKHTDVQATIAAYIATVEVTQQFHNPYDEKIEAVYVFPLPENAAINEFIMTVGERKIRGIIRERQEAEQIYHEARAAGHVASLLTQERANVFTQKVANIEPGKAIDIHIRYFHTLAYDDGWYEYVFPMVVGPRFNPPATASVASTSSTADPLAPASHVAPSSPPVNEPGEVGRASLAASEQGDGIGVVARGNRGASGQKTEVQYLAPGERSGHDIALVLTIDAGVEIEDVRSVNHVIETRRDAEDLAQVRLSDRDAIPNKDFVLRYKVAGDRIKSALLTQHADDGGYFTLMLYPPDSLNELERAPVELIFVLDSSGSMNGRPIEQAKAAIQRGLARLRPDDTFQLINFADDSSQLGRAPLAATPTNIRRGMRYLSRIDGDGGTMMIEGIRAALDFPHDPRRLRFVCFLTDGYIGNEVEILGAVHRRLGASRVFSFGVGSAPNRFLMDRMAKLGRGAVAYLSLNDDGADVMDRFFDRISHPALTDVQIDWGGLTASDVFPAPMPDLFVGRPVVLTGRFSGTPTGPIRVTGRAGDQRREIVIDAAPMSVSSLTARGDGMMVASTGGDHGTNGSHGIDTSAGAGGAASDGDGPDGTAAQQNGLRAVWARAKIADLMDRATYDAAAQNELAGQVRQIALNYGLMSQFTAFVAVDSLTRTAGAHGTTVAVPVPVPDGVKYETTVHE